MTVHVINSLSEFRDVISSHPAVAIDAWATWCGPCRMMSPIFEELSNTQPFSDEIYFAKFDVDVVDDLAQELGVRAMPTFFFFKGEDKVNELVGANPPALQQAIKGLLE